MNRAQQRERLRAWWAAYAAKQPTPKRAWGMAAALYRYFTARSLMRSDRSSSSTERVEPVAPVSGTPRIGGIDEIR